MEKEFHEKTIAVTDNDGEPLLEYDMLVLGHRDLPSLLVDGVVRPPGVEAGQPGGDPVVLPHEEGVQHDQVQLLVHAEVASKETILNIFISVGI